MSTSFNPNQAGVSVLKKAGGQMSHKRKSAILAIFLHSRWQESYQGTQGTQKLPQSGSQTSHGPSVGLTGSFKRTLLFSRFCKAVFTFSNKIHSFKPCEQHVYGHCCTSPTGIPHGPSWNPKGTLRLTLRDWFWGTLADKRPSRVPPRSKLINFFS